MFATEGAATNMIMGGRGALALAGVMCWVTTRMHLMGSVGRTLIRGFIGVKVVGLIAKTFMLR
jgi:hypothetical protein